MVEIVFSESACGSLKIAQTYGRGKYRGSAISVFIRHENGSVPSSNEMKEAQLQAQEQECIAWENAIPLGGKSSDVYCFDMALSVGDISDNGIGEQRKNIFKKMLSVCFVEDLGQYRTTATIRIAGRPFCKNPLGRPCFCSQERTDSSCQTGSVSQNQICQRKHDIEFGLLLFKPSVSCFSETQLLFNNTEYMLYFCSD